MKKDKATLYKCYQLLHDVLTDAFHTEAILFEAPYKDLARIDQGFRATVWNNYNDEVGRIKLSEHPSKYRMFVIKSNLGFYNVLVFFCTEEKPDFISIGPFRDEELSANYYTQILKEAHITPMDFQGMKYRYERMPYANTEVITKTVKHIIRAFFEDFKEVAVEFVEYSEQNRKAAVNLDVMKRYSIEFTEKYKAQLFVFLKHIKCGDLPQARENPEYSKMTKDVIDYIQLHLEEELSLKYLADIFGKNTSVLSAAFSKDTGVSLTKYIQQTRMQEASFLFNTTGLSVSEVAVAVGYQDFSYFSKIFSKEIGCSPREYKMKKVT